MNLVLLIRLKWVGFAWRQRQNSVSEMLHIWNKKNWTMDKSRNIIIVLICHYHKLWELIQYEDYWHACLFLLFLASILIEVIEKLWKTTLDCQWWSLLIFMVSFSSISPDMGTFYVEIIIQSSRKMSRQWNQFSDQ
jgi:hypothetical protein